MKLVAFIKIEYDTDPSAYDDQNPREMLKLDLNQDPQALLAESDFTIVSAVLQDENT